MYVCDCSTGVSVRPPVTLRSPPARRHVTSPLCFPAQEDLSKNVFLFKGSQQPSFLLCLAALCVCLCVSKCVCTLVIPYIVSPKNRNCWDADEDAEGCVFSSPVCTYIQSRILFNNTLWIWWRADAGALHVTTHFILSDIHTLKHNVPPTLYCSVSPLHRVTSGPDHSSAGTQSLSWGSKGTANYILTGMM